MSLSVPRLHLLAGLVTLCSLFGGATAQDEICSCSPSSYEMSFDFSLVCPPVDVTLNGGVAETSCQISPLGGVFDDVVPVEVTSVVFLELGQDSIPVSQTNITGPFFDGDEIVYTSSLVGQDAATVPSDDIPKIVQFNIFATNAAGQSIVNFFAIAFTNDCSVVPVFEEGDSAGWLKFDGLASPPRGFCTAADVPTASPVAPTEPPVSTPTPPEPSMSMSMSMSMDIMDLFDIELFEAFGKGSKKSSKASKKGSKGSKKGTKKRRLRIHKVEV